jgi:mercuric ion transport protein
VSKPAGTVDYHARMRDRLLQAGVIGMVVAALCCFTPVLVVLLAAVGLSALVGWLDYVLLPAMAIFAALTIYALTRRYRA